MSRSPHSNPPPARRAILILNLLLVLAIGIVFGQTISHDFVNFDDDVYVTENAHTRQGLNLQTARWAFGNLSAGFWHPLTWLSLMADAQLYGARPGGFHFTNVLLHAANTLLLFALLRYLTASIWRSAVVAALFAVHPLHVESVAWVAQRKDLLSTLFAFLTLLAYSRHARGRPGEQGRKPRSFPKFYVFALVLFACGLMSKSAVVTLPLVMLLLDFWPLRRFQNISDQSRWRLWLEKVPFLALAFVAGWLTIHAEHQIGALGEAGDVSIKLRVANLLLSCARYVWQSLWPVKLAVFYPHLDSFPTMPVLVSLLFLILMSVVAYRAKSSQPYLLVGWLWYLLTLLPMSGLIQVGPHAFADRYTYVPLIGIFLMAAWGFTGIFARWRAGPAALRVLTILVLAGSVVAAHLQTRYWRDSVSLWRRSLACTAANSLAHINLADALNGEQRWDEAIQESRRAVQLKPDAADAYVNLGFAFAGQGELEKAIPQYERALQIQPHFAEAHANLGIALAQLGRTDDAIRHCERALRLKPDSARLHYNLGLAFAANGKLTEASRHYERALELQPDHASAHNNLANALAMQGRLNEAVDHYRTALALQPNPEACFNLATALAGTGRRDAAIPYFEQALRLAAAQSNSALAEVIRRQIKAQGIVLPNAK